ncbi:MAG: SURF1 family protein [Pseudomonadota bacterium]
MTGLPGPRRLSWLDALLLCLAFVVFATLTGLGVWQVQRLHWKLDLIEAVETRAFGEPVAPPAGEISAAEHAYLRVRILGTFRHDLSVTVKAITELGPGHWVLTPMRLQMGHVWVNRGFVPAGTDRTHWVSPDAPLKVTGLLRITEEGGTLLESNEPASGRWVSRDVAALSAHAGLQHVRPYFIDADHAAAPDAWPRGGMTIVKFRNPHLAYALTWFAMAALLLGAVVYLAFNRSRY